MQVQHHSAEPTIDLLLLRFQQSECDGGGSGCRARKRKALGRRSKSAEKPVVTSSHASCTLPGYTLTGYHAELFLSALRFSVGSAARFGHSPFSSLCSCREETTPPNIWYSSVERKPKRVRRLCITIQKFSGVSVRAFDQQKRT